MKRVFILTSILVLLLASTAAADPGDTLWTRTYGGGDVEEGWCVQQTHDGGYIIAGHTASFGAGNYDVYVVKTATNGDTLWTRSYGGGATDRGFFVQQTSDGGYIIAGYTESFGAGATDVYLLRTDSSGDTLWTRTYGGDQRDYGWEVVVTPDGGFAVAAQTASFGAGRDDVYLVKTDASGDSLWTRTYGGSSLDYGFSLQHTSDGGYVVAGFTYSFGAGGYDLYVVKTDANGNTLWTRTYGGSGYDYARSVRQTTDGGYIVAGYTESFGAGGYDVYLVRVAGESSLPDVTMEILPDDPPVVVPQGGSFGYTGTVTNNTDEVQFVDIWTMAYVPGMGWHGPFKNYNNVRFNPRQVRSAHLEQRVPNAAPAGDGYLYCGYVGDHPSTVIDSSCFPFEVIAAAPTEAGEAGWVLTGSFLEGDFADLPSEFALLSNYPNPFNAQTVIEYQLPVSSTVKLEVYNILGEKVATLVNGQEQAGYRSVTWDASEISSGIYFYKLSAGDYTETMRMILVK